MQVIVEAKINIRKEDAELGIDYRPLLKFSNTNKIEEWRKAKKEALLAGISENLEGHDFKMKSGAYENLIYGQITKVKKIRMRGKTLYP